MIARLIPPCGANERLNAWVHGGVAVIYLLMALYHGSATLEHWRRR